MKRPLALSLSALALLVFGVAAAVAASSSNIPNGDFEKGNFKDWTHVTTDGGRLFVYNASERDKGQDGLLPKPIGKYSAGNTQGGPSSSYLTRVLQVPNDATTLTLKFFWRNLCGTAPAGGSAPRDRAAASRVGEWNFPGSWDIDSGDIQFFKIDLIKPGASARTTNKSDVLAGIFAPKIGSTKAQSGWTSGSVNVTRFQGEKVRFRLIQADDCAPLNMGLDELRFVSAKPPTG